MHAQNLLPHLEELTPEAAQRWVVVALAEAAALREHDDRLYPAGEDARGMQTADRLHDAWRHWADDADALLSQVRVIPGGKSVPGGDELAYAVARARAMLKITPRSVCEAREQVRRGEVSTIQEVRRELGLEHHG